MRSGLRTRKPQRARRGILAIAAVALVAVCLVAFPSFRPTALLRDFSAFYCAGAAIDAKANPYLEEPLGRCERAAKPPGLHRGIAGLAVPAPLPPFALGGFAVLARVPYGLAALIWTAFLGAAVWATVAALVRLGVGVAPAIAALALTDGLASLALGQIAPLAIAAIVLAAEALRRDRPAVAGAVASLALIEPHLALPSLVAIGIARRASRVPIGIAAAAFTLASLVLVGEPTCLSYLRDVLPAHARSEIASTRQFSLTVVLVEVGISAETALTLGNLSYLLSASVGVVAGLRLGRERDASLIALGPMAFAVTGGPFVHIVQLAAASPFGLMLLRDEPVPRERRRLRTTLRAATIALAVPWVQFASLGDILLPLSATACGALSLAFAPALRRATVVALAPIAFLLLLGALARDVPLDQSATLVAHADPRALAEASWTRYVAGVGESDRLAYDLARLPTWLGALAIVTVGAMLAFARKGSSVEKRISSPP